MTVRNIEVEAVDCGSMGWQWRCPGPGLESPFAVFWALQEDALNHGRCTVSRAPWLKPVRRRVFPADLIGTYAVDVFTPGPPGHLCPACFGVYMGIREVTLHDGCPTPADVVSSV